MLLGLGLTVGLFGGQARLQGVAARLLEAISAACGLAFLGGLVCLERGDGRRATVLLLLARSASQRSLRAASDQESDGKPGARDGCIKHGEPSVGCGAVRQALGGTDAGDTPWRISGAGT
jgi:hypothetical protein